ncbi:hypothetical protein L7F22_004957 [Adiantum nelumboides]|nr:hypothetical protein [Adiantum nelumboides]
MQTLKKNDYADFLDRILLKHNMSDDIEESWDIFRHALEEAAESIMGRTKKWKQDVKGLPHNPWFDEECKVAKRMLITVPHSTEEWNHAMKKYNTLKRRKRRMYELAKEEQDVKQFKRDPKRSWRQMKGRKADIMGDFSPKDMYDYVQKLYAPKEVQRMTDATIQVKMQEPITFRATMKGLKKLAIGKASNTLKFSFEMLKWSGNEAKEWMHGMMNKAVLQGLPSDWQENWIKALFKGGDRNQLTNIAPSWWVRAKPKHSTVDHLVTLRILMEETRLKGKTLYCCFVDFKKAFDTVPRKGLWNRMESIGVPLHLRAAVARLYEEVKCKLKMQTGFSQEFMSTMGVKQGCPLSPTLFGLCINQLEDFVGHVLEEEKDKPSIGAFTLLLLMYADDVVLFGYSIHVLQKLLHSVHAFCDATGLSVNVAKTKVMMVRTHKTADQPILMYNGQSLEVVDSFKYLGINVPSNHAWGHCAQSGIEASKAKYYEFENMCKQSVTKRWEIKALVFETCVVQTLLYGVEVWGASISASIWNDIEKLQKKFLCRYMGVKATTPYSVMLLETGKRPLEMLALQRVHKYIMKRLSRVKTVENHIISGVPKESSEMTNTPRTPTSIKHSFATVLAAPRKRVAQLQTALDRVMEENGELKAHISKLEARFDSMVNLATNKVKEVEAKVTQAHSAAIAKVKTCVTTELHEGKSQEENVLKVCIGGLPSPWCTKEDTLEEAITKLNDILQTITIQPEIVSWINDTHR